MKRTIYECEQQQCSASTQTGEGWHTLKHERGSVRIQEGIEDGKNVHHVCSPECAGLMVQGLLRQVAERTKDKAGTRI